MADKQPKTLYTLTDVSKKVGISMPTLQRYKKLYQDRIPSVGEGRSQRYPKEALAVFEELKVENFGRRGRPRKDATAGSKPAAKKSTRKATAKKAGRPKKAAAKKATAKKAPAKKAATRKAAKSTEGLLTLREVSNLTSISYPTLLRYVKSNLANIPHKGTGRARRYHPEAVDVFKQMRSESRRGRAAAPKAAAKKGRPARKTAAKRGPGRPRKAVAASSDDDLAARVRDLEKQNKQFAKLLARLEKKLDKPFRVVLQRK